MASVSARTTDRPLRADARRNQQAILQAARAVFAESGPTTTLEAVAERAGVGKGTLYRRFESRRELVLALIAQVRTECETVAERCERLHDPWQHLRALILGLAWTHRPVVPAIDALSHELPREAFCSTHAFFLGLVKQPLQRCHAEQVLQRTVDAETALAFVRMFAGMRDAPGQRMSFAEWASYADLALVGLRDSGRETVLPDGRQTPLECS